MKTSRLVSYSLVAVLASGCKSRGYNNDSRAKDTSSAAPGAAPANLKPAVFNEMAEFRLDPTNRLNYSPMTPCDLFVWAESVWPTLPTDPAEFAKALKAGGTRNYIDLKIASGVPTKKKVPVDEAIRLINAYLVYQDADAQVMETVNDAWISAIIKHGRGWDGSPGYNGDGMEKKAGTPFSSEAIAECKAYVENIQPGGDRAMHMVGDYIAHVYAQNTLKDPDAKYGLKNTDWAKEFLSSDVASKIPFLSFTFGAPPSKDFAAAPRGKFDPKLDTRRFVVPNVSYRTFKALQNNPGYRKIYQDLKLKAYCYFKDNRQADYRNTDIPDTWSVASKTTNTNWFGSWSSNSVDAYSSFEEVERELGKPSCAGVDANQPF